jgi:hypothetical protein
VTAAKVVEPENLVGLVKVNLKEALVSVKGKTVETKRAVELDDVLGNVVKSPKKEVNQSKLNSEELGCCSGSVSGESDLVQFRSEVMFLAAEASFFCGEEYVIWCACWLTLQRATKCCCKSRHPFRLRCA